MAILYNLFWTHANQIWIELLLNFLLKFKCDNFEFAFILYKTIFFPFSFFIYLFFLKMQAIWSRNITNWGKWGGVVVWLLWWSHFYLTWVSFFIFFWIFFRKMITLFIIRSFIYWIDKRIYLILTTVLCDNEQMKQLISCITLIHSILIKFRKWHWSKMMVSVWACTLKVAWKDNVAIHWMPPMREYSYRK